MFHVHISSSHYPRPYKADGLVQFVVREVGSSETPSAAVTTRFYELGNRTLEVRVDALDV
jgi:hypothetical protein